MLNRRGHRAFLEKETFVANEEFRSETGCWRMWSCGIIEVCFVLRNKDWNVFRKLGNCSANFGMWKGQNAVERRSHKVWWGSGGDS
jgi:hypothetical protein